jgi:hypothetical protein
MNASRHTPVLLALCLLFAASAAAAGNREPRLHGPGGDGGACTEVDAGGASEAAAVTATKPAAVAPAKPAATVPARIKPVVTVRGGGGDDSTGSVHAPRWHSFLPGMFR